MLQWRLWNEMRSQHQPVFCRPAQWSPSQTGLGNLATRGSERGFRFPALWGRESWNDASDLQLQWWKYRSFHHRDPFQGVQSSQKKSQKLSTPLDQECKENFNFDPFYWFSLQKRHLASPLPLPALNSQEVFLYGMLGLSDFLSSTSPK